MPDFKVVVSDPDAPKRAKLVKVKIEGDPEIPLTDKVKEQFELPIIKMNSKTAQKLEAIHGVVTLRAKRPDTGTVVKYTGRLVVDDNVPEGVAKVSLEKLMDMTGLNEIEGYAFRARAWQVRINDERTSSFLGLKIGDTLDGSVLGLRGVKLRITGGSDNSGFPMRADIHGPVKRKALLAGPPGFRPEKKGLRKRVMIRGNAVAPDIVQINTVIVYQ